MDISAFRGYRYDSSAAGDGGACIAPPWPQDDGGPGSEATRGGIPSRKCLIALHLVPSPGSGTQGENAGAMTENQ